jgi:hypothetical protein
MKVHWLQKLAAPLTLMIGVAAAGLVGCGQIKEESKPSYVRVVNTASELGALDVTFGDTELARALQPNSATGDYREVATESKTLRVRNAAGSTLYETSVTPAKDTRYLYLITGSDGALAVNIVTDNESEPSSGKSKLRVIHSSPDAGTMDVYVNRTGDSSSFLSSTLSGIAYGRTTAYYEVDQGAHVIRATLAGDRADPRLEIANVNLADRQRATLVLSPTSGGALVHAVMIIQEGSSTSYENQWGRVRLVASVDSPAVVTAAISGEPAIGSGTSPSVSNYTRVTKGSPNITIALGGVPTRTQAVPIRAGTDTTLLVFGEPSNLRVAALDDINRLPTSSTRAFVRTVHAVNGLAGTITTNADFTPINSQVSYGAASAYASLTGATYSRVDVTEPSTSTPIYLRTDFELAAQTVYTLFMLGNRAAPIGIMRRDR